MYVHITISIPRARQACQWFYVLIFYWFYLFIPTYLYSEHNQTCQWFYAKFIHEDGRNFPLGEAPLYGLPSNTGNIFFDPFETNNEGHTLGLFNGVNDVTGEGMEMDHSLSEKGILRAIQLRNLRTLQ
jgi:hypothetical protein